MNSIQLQLTLTKIPAGGKVLMISSFNPSFWKNQPKTTTIEVDSEQVKSNNEFRTKSTNEFYVVFRCEKPPCGEFELEYERIEMEEEEHHDHTKWELYIDVCIGIPIMVISLLYFEWRTIFKCILKCKARLCQRGNRSQIGLAEDAAHQAKLNSEQNVREGEDESLEDNLSYNIGRITQKSKRLDNSIGEAIVGFDEYSTKRKDD